MNTLLYRFVLVVSILLPGARSSLAVADVIGFSDLSGVDSPVSFGGTLVDNHLMPPSGFASLTAYQPPPQNLGSFGINIVPGGALAGNAQALAAFNRAAQSWAARISDPITITINADLAPLGAGIIGSTSSVILQAGYNTIRNAMVADAAAAGPANAVMAFTPTAAQFSAAVPAARSLNGNLVATKANLKALGFSDLDGSFGASDASITFSTLFPFDFDHSDGVGAGQVDFETVAAHEIGHALGFFSTVDDIDFGTIVVQPTTLDLLRFGNDIPGQDPATMSDFTLFPRNLVPGQDAVTDDISGPEWRMSTGLVGGDGRQASHWKSDELTGTLIGLMDPTLANGVFYGPADSDFRALDLIGYDVVVPEPGSLSLFALAGTAFLIHRRRA